MKWFFSLLLIASLAFFGCKTQAPPGAAPPPTDCEGDANDSEANHQDFGREQDDATGAIHHGGLKNPHKPNRLETHAGRNHAPRANLKENVDWRYDSQEEIRGKNRNKKNRNHQIGNEGHADVPKLSKKELRKRRKAAKALNLPTHASTIGTSTTDRNHQHQTKHAGANADMRNTHNTANHHQEDHHEDMSDYKHYENTHLSNRQKKKLARESRRQKQNDQNLNGNGGQQQRGQQQRGQQQRGQQQRGQQQRGKRKQRKGQKQKHQQPQSGHFGQVMDHLHGAAESDVEQHSGGDHHHSVDIHIGGKQNAQNLTKKERKKLARQRNANGGNQQNAQQLSNRKRKKLARQMNGNGGNNQLHDQRFEIHLNGHQKKAQRSPPRNLQTDLGISGKHSTHGFDHMHIHLQLHRSHPPENDSERVNSDGQ